MKKKGLFVLLTASICLAACSSPATDVSLDSQGSASPAGALVSVSSQNNSSAKGSQESVSSSYTNESANSSSSSLTGTRDNTPVVLTPTASGILSDGNSYATVDYSNATDGYIMVEYLGSVSKVKLQITGPNKVTYTYDMGKGFQAFPLTSGDGDYEISVCENIEGTKYSLAFKTVLSLKGISEFGPYLYPNQYVNFTKGCKTVKKGEELAKNCNNDLEVITYVYNYIIKNISYDYKKADSVQSGYIADVDSILKSGTGICLDYAAVMTTMLRSQSIPTRLEVGYVGVDMLYHAWISVYIEDIGWLNGVIQFNGYEWSLVDPTFGASTSESTLKDYIGTGDNYSTKYIY